MVYEKKTLAALFREQRNKNGKISVKEVSNELKLSQVYIYELEEGKRIPLKGRGLKEIAKFCNKTEKEIYEIAVYSKFVTFLADLDRRKFLDNFFSFIEKNEELIDKQKIVKIMDILFSKDDIKKQVFNSTDEKIINLEYSTTK